MEEPKREIHQPNNVDPIELVERFKASGIVEGPPRRKRSLFDLVTGGRSRRSSGRDPRRSARRDSAASPESSTASRHTLTREEARERARERNRRRQRRMRRQQRMAALVSAAKLVLTWIIIASVAYLAFSALNR